MLFRSWFERENNRPWYRKALSPPIIAILMRSGTVNGEAISRKQAGRADLIVEPPLGGIEIRQWKCFDETIEIGYNETMKQLKNAKPQFT